MTVWIAILACGGTPAEQGPVRPGHATEWDALKAAAARDDLATVRVLARDFSLGDVPDDHPAADQLGAALGLLQVAEDAEDVALALERAEAACDACHRVRKPRR